MPTKTTSVTGLLPIVKPFTNDELHAHQMIQRPRFYNLLKESPFLGELTPREIDGRLRWSTVDQDTGEVKAVSLVELRNAKVYDYKDQYGAIKQVYLFIYGRRGQPKPYYVIPGQYTGLWWTELARMDMLSDHASPSISSARHVIIPDMLRKPPTTQE